MKIVGWILSLVLAALLIFGSAMSKFNATEDFAKELDRQGWSAEAAKRVGIVEVGIAVLFLIPQTSFLGAILITAYLGGAVATHVRINDSTFFVPIIVAIVAWIAVGLRDWRVFDLAFFRPPKDRKE